MITNRTIRNTADAMADLESMERGDNAPTAEQVEKWLVDINARENITIWTAVVIALNWEIWKNYEKNEKKARGYNELWAFYDNLTFKIWNGDNLTYYIRETD